MPRVDWFITELSIKGGAENFVLRVLPHLAHYGWQIRAITLQEGGNSIKQLEQAGIPCVELNFRPTTAMTAIYRLDRMWANSPPIILHTHLYHAGILGRILAIKRKIPVVLVHQHGLERNRTNLRSFLDHNLSPWVTQYVVSSQAVSNILQSREGIPKSKINILYNGVSPERINSVTETTPKKNGLPGQSDLPFIVGCVGRLEPEKGHEDLLHGFSGLTRNDKNSSQLWLIGEGTLKERLKRITCDLGIEKQVLFLGAQDSIPSFLAKMDLFILPSRWEGLSMALLEAMSQGIPVIATDVGGTPEVITNSYNGLLIPANDPSAITRAIECLRQDPLLRQKIGSRGREYVSTKFTLEQTVRSLDELYRRFI